MPTPLFSFHLNASNVSTKNNSITKSKPIEHADPSLDTPIDPPLATEYIIHGKGRLKNN